MLALPGARAALLVIKEPIISENIKLICLQVFAVTQPDWVVSLSVWSVRWKESCTKIEKRDRAHVSYSVAHIPKSSTCSGRNFNLCWLIDCTSPTYIYIAFCNKVIIHCQYSTSLFPFALTDSLFTTTAITCITTSTTSLCLLWAMRFGFVLSVKMSIGYWCLTKLFVFVMVNVVFFSKCATMGESCGSYGAIPVILPLLLLLMLHFMSPNTVGMVLQGCTSPGEISLMSLLPSLCCASICLQGGTGSEPIWQISIQSYGCLSELKHNLT